MKANRILIIGIVVLAVVVVLIAKTSMQPEAAPVPATGQEAQVPASLTASRNDASADYAAASTLGKPVYILFHSLS